MKLLLALLTSLSFVPMAAAQEISSVYTDLDPDTTCITVDQAAEGNGDWATQTCSGYMGYPVVVSYDDARESVFYGFPPSGDGNVWESFQGFNAAGNKVEWRVRKEGDKTVPFATIHRWSVADPEDSEKKVEVLVVEKVGQLGERAGCAIGLVLATGNAQANETARKIADEQAETFACGDERTVVGEPMPGFDRQAN